MLNNSQLYTFIDKNKQFALYFLEGQKLIHDLVLSHNPKQGGFSYFRTAALSVQLMLGLLKENESFCFYIDSETPYFRLKIEMNSMGLMRGMMYSDLPGIEPAVIDGQIRLMKFQPGSEMPYQSTIELKKIDMKEIMNIVLSRSYQVNSRIYVSENSDQSIMLHQLPLSRKEEQSDLNNIYKKYISSFSNIMKQALTDTASIIKAFDQHGFKFLASKTVQYKCGCSKEQMIQNVFKFLKSSKEDIFPPGKDSIEVVCEYCKTAYSITEKEIDEISTKYH